MSMKILKLTAENVKKLVAVEIVPVGPLVQVTGKNASGKSSVLDSIMYALAGKDAIPSDPIRHGEVRAKIKLDMGELVVTRVITSDKNELRVENANGNKVASPQKVLDDLLGALSFDPLEFTRLKAKNQFERLRQIVPIGIDLDAVDAEIVRLRDERLVAGRDVKTTKSHLEGFPEIPADLPTEKLTVSDVADELTKATAHNGEVQRLRGLHERRETKLVDIDEEVRKLHDRIVALQVEREKVMSYSLEEADPEIAIEPITARLNDIGNLNALIDKREEKRRMNASLVALEEDYEKLGDEIAKKEREKREAIESAKMPVPGLGLGEGIVTFHGVPLDQCSTAEQLRVSVAIAMAANPQLRVLRIMEGALLDEDSLAMIAEMAHDQDYQIWVEKVDSSGKVGIVISEGQVVGDYQEAFVPYVIPGVSQETTDAFDKLTTNDMVKEEADLDAIAARMDGDPVPRRIPSPDEEIPF